MDHIVKNIYIFIFVGPQTCGPFNNHSGSHLASQFVHVWEVLEDHLLNSGYQSASELRPHHNGDICITRKMTSASYMGHDVKKKNIFGYLGSLWEDFNNRIGPISVRIYHLIYVNLHVKYGRNLIRTVLIKILNMKNMVFCCIFGAVRGVLTLNPGVPRCPQMQTSSLGGGGGGGGRSMLCLKFIRNT